jgi:hypothetical protein
MLPTGTTDIYMPFSPIMIYFFLKMEAARFSGILVSCHNLEDLDLEEH